MHTRWPWAMRTSCPLATSAIPTAVVPALLGESADACEPSPLCRAAPPTSSLPAALPLACDTAAAAPAAATIPAAAAGRFAPDVSDKREAQDAGRGMQGMLCSLRLE
eukprot:4500744-Pyramimonas_sp.AAC.1